MKNCVNCGGCCNDDSLKSCPYCGTDFPVQKQAGFAVQKCPKCGSERRSGSAAFCEICGYNFNAQQKPQPVVLQPAPPNTAVCTACGCKLGDNNAAFCPQCGAPVKVQPVVTTDKPKLKLKSNIVKIIAPIAAVVLLLIIVVSNIHTCEECDKTYLGKKYTITFWDESENVCKDCYEDFYSFN